MNQDTIKTNKRPSAEIDQREKELVQSCLILSEAVLDKIWNNPEDADYDEL